MMINRKEFEQAFVIPSNIQWNPDIDRYLDNGKQTSESEKWDFVYAGFRRYARMVESDDQRLMEALEDVCDCIMETRGPNAHEAVANARELLEECKQKRKEMVDK